MERIDLEQKGRKRSHTTCVSGVEMNRNRGFTLIELLVVIAIIAILAAIIFPVFSQVRASAYRGSDLSNMNAIRSALQLYRQDQGGYPPSLLGYVTTYSGDSPSVGDIIPANQVVGALYPKRIDSLTTLQPAYDRIPAGGTYTSITQAVWPNKAPGGGSLYPNAPQKYGPTDVNNLGNSFVLSCNNPNNGNPADVTDVTNYYYTISGYDVATVPNETGGGQRIELHYAPFWSIYTVATDPCHPLSSETGNALDDVRQLGYSDPPETTVVTWDSFFRDYSGGTLTEDKKDIVLFLGGSARPYDSVLVDTMSWKVGP